MEHLFNEEGVTNIKCNILEAQQTSRDSGFNNYEFLLYRKNKFVGKLVKYFRSVNCTIHNHQLIMNSFAKKQAFMFLQK